MINEQLLGELINAPLALLTIKDKEIINHINNLIPYSTGFEIECDMSESYNVNNFKRIPDILDINNSSCEQRYRIPNGIKGMICLYNICIQLRLNSLLNPLSGIHYHIDCKTDNSWSLLSDNLLDKNSKWILPELDKWEFRGTQRRGIGNQNSWIRRNELNTLEFRIGNMSFDYKILLQNIISANSIIKKLKDSINIETQPVFEEVDSTKILNYLKTVSYNSTNKINSLKNKVEELKAQQVKKPELIFTEAPPIVRSRTHIFKPSNH